MAQDFKDYANLANSLEALPETPLPPTPVPMQQQPIQQQQQQAKTEPDDKE
jgi:hypothetical protein